MRALTWHGSKDVRVDTVPDPEIVNPRDAIIEVTSTAICGSDLHLYDGVIPGMEAGDILGHEFMGRVVEVGPDSTLRIGQRVVVPFTISCGACFFCEQCTLFGLRQLQSGRGAGRDGATLRPRDVRHLRLFAPDRRLSRADRPNMSAFPSRTSDPS